MTFLRRQALLLVLVVFALCVGIGLYIQLQQKKVSEKDPALLENLTYYTTPHPGFDVNQALRAFQSGQFRPVYSRVLNGGVARQYYWVHFTVSNVRGEDVTMVLDIDNSRLNHLELWKVAGDTAGSLGSLGDWWPYHTRVIKDKCFLYNLQSEAGTTTDYLLYVNQVGSTLTLPLNLLTLEEWEQGSYLKLLLDGLVYGILLFVAVLSLFFYFASRYKLYLYYALYIFSGVAWLFSYFGMGYAYLWGQWPAVNLAAAPMMASLNLLLNLQICYVLLGMNTGNPKIARVFNGCKAWLLLLTLLPLINLQRYGYALNAAYLYVFLISMLAAVLLLLGAVLQDAFRKSAAARVYLVASLFKGLSIAMLALLELGLFPAMPGMEGWLQVGILLEIALLSYALARRYASYKLNSFAKVIEAHEKERTIISREIHDSISNALIGLCYAMEDLQVAEPGISADGKQRLSKIAAALRLLQTEARNISHNVMPDYIHNHTLTEIVERYMQELQQQYGSQQNHPIAFSFSANDEAYLFPEAVRMNIFRIIQEMMGNTIKHSKATHAELVLDFMKSKLVITAEDNGVGGVNRDVSKKGMGLRNLKARAELLHAEVHVSSHLTRTGLTETTTASYGTRIQLKIPYGNRSKSNHNHDY